MTEAEFAFLRHLLRERSGLALGPDKRYLVESRLRPLCRTLGIGSLPALIAMLRERGDAALVQSVVEAMATGETLFFRDKAPFDAIRSRILPRLIESRSASRRLRIWSAAASTGQEAYSLAMIVAEMGPALAGWQVSILATDLSREAIERARAGRYSQFEVQRGLPIRSLLRHFSQDADGWQISGTLRRAIDFRVLNLIDGMGPLGAFDLILCRNLLIYFDPAGKASLLGDLTGALARDGILCLGSAETARGIAELAPEPALHGFYRRESQPGHGIADTRQLRLRAVG